MRNKMKKVLAAILAVSLLMSSAHCTSAWALFGRDILGDNLNMTGTVCIGKNNIEKCFTDKGFSKQAARVLVNLVKNAEVKDLIIAATNGLVTEIPRLNGGGVWSALKSLFNSGGGVFAFFMVSIFVNKITQMYKTLKAKIEAGKVEKPVDPIATMQMLDMLMFSIKGQEGAKRQIRSTVLNIVDKNAQFMANKNSKKAGPGANVIYMVGPSGVGKSFSAEIIRKVLSGFSADPFVIEASDIDKQSKASAVDQLVGMRIKRINNSEYYEYSPLIIRLKAIPNTTVVINEYDKMHSKELDEKLRTIMDQGYINVNGEKIDCSAATFIITSNESYGSVHKNNNEVDNVDDGTGSRTFIDHDKAFLNRIKLIEFDNLSAPEYREIAFEPFIKLAIRYKAQYGIDIDLNGTVDTVAKRTEQLNKGARPIFAYLEDLNDKLLNEVVLCNLKKGHSQTLKYKVYFDENNDSFTLEKIVQKMSTHHRDNDFTAEENENIRNPENATNNAEQENSKNERNPSSDFDQEEGAQTYDALGKKTVERNTENIEFSGSAINHVA